MSPWEPGPRLLGNLYTIILGTLTTFTWKTWEPCREPWGNLGTFTWEPFGNLGNLEGTLRNLGNLEGTLGTLGTFTWEPLLGNLGTFTWEPWEPLLGNLYLGTWEPLLGTFTWEPLLGNLGTFTWEPLLGNLYLGTFTGNLYLGTWEPLLGTWEPWGNGFWSCSGLLRNLYYGWRPQSILLLGKKEKGGTDGGANRSSRHTPQCHPERERKRWCQWWGSEPLIEANPTLAIGTM